MGQFHFMQMYNDAAARDCAAMPQALLMIGAVTAAEKDARGMGYWDDLTIDVLFEKARRLVDLRDCFSERLKLMLLDGEILVLVRDPVDGRVHRLRDTDVIDFDDPIVGPEQFFTLAEKLIEHSA